MIRFFLDGSEQSKEVRINSISLKLRHFSESESINTIIEILEKVSGLKRKDYSCDKSYLQEFNSRRGERQVGTSKASKLNDVLRPFKEELYKAFYELGFISVNTPVFNFNSYDLIMVLGGGNDANYNRMKKSFRELQRLKNVTRVVALSTFRTLGDNELNRTKLYTNEKNEFGVISDCMSQIFGVGSDVDVLFENFTDDPTTSSKIVRFKNKYKERVTLESYAAPKGDSERTRADTRDTYNFFFQHNCIPENSTILLISSNIYPVQQIPFIDYAINKKLNVDFVGNWEDDELTSVDTFNPAAYINELIKMFVEIEKLEKSLSAIRLSD